MNPPTEEQFAQVETELKPYLSLLSKANDTILDEGVSKYPIIVYSQEPVELGISLFEQNNLFFRASTLEEFFVKQLIEPGQLEHFKSIYKQPKRHLCIFVIQHTGNNFCFIKRNF